MAACNTQTPSTFVTKDYDLDEVTKVARQALTALQEPSFAENVEYCGFIGRNPLGEIKALPPHRGAWDRCELWYFPADWKIVAMYHTHGGYDPQKKSEAPSVLDLKSIAPHGLVGFLGTPGGRFWIFGGDDATAELICGPACLPQDPTYVEDMPLKDIYTIEELAERERKKARLG